MTDSTQTAAFTPNDLLGLAHLFKLAADNPQRVPGQVFVLLPQEDCVRLSTMLLAESVRMREDFSDAG